MGRKKLSREEGGGGIDARGSKEGQRCTWEVGKGGEERFFLGTELLLPRPKPTSAACMPLLPLPLGCCCHALKLLLLPAAAAWQVEIDSVRLVKLCRESGLLAETGLTTARVDLCFTKIRGKVGEGSGLGLLWGLGGVNLHFIVSGPRWAGEQHATCIIADGQNLCAGPQDQLHALLLANPNYSS